MPCQIPQSYHCIRGALSNISEILYQWCHVRYLRAIIVSEAPCQIFRAIIVSEVPCQIPQSYHCIGGALSDTSELSLYRKCPVKYLRAIIVSEVPCQIPQSYLGFFHKGWSRLWFKIDFLSEAIIVWFSVRSYHCMIFCQKLSLYALFPCRNSAWLVLSPQLSTSASFSFQT